MNPLRHDFISACRASQTEESPLRGLRYLDVGCGGGIFAESAARMSQVESVTGIDPSSNVLSVAISHARQDPSLQNESKLNYINTSIEGLPVPTASIEKFDVLSLFEVIEHISDPSSFLESCLPFVKPGGWIVMSTIARTWTSWLTTKIVAEDLAGIVPRGTHDWQKYINEDELRSWFAKRGMTSARSMGVIYVPGVGWKEVQGSEKWGNYFFGVRKASD
jgi:polyprenyldihydroxybenzoate methyltransferase/3-demethylubiquinol 3-O-methyltransferase